MAYIILAIVSVAAIIMSLILPVKDYPQKEYKKINWILLINTGLLLVLLTKVVQWMRELSM